MAKLIQIGDAKTDLRFTLGTIKRIRTALKLSMQEFGEQLEAGKFDVEEHMGVLAWALIAHNKELRELTIEDVEGGIRLEDFRAVIEALTDVLQRQAGGQTAPPPAAPRKKAKSRRAKN